MPIAGLQPLRHRSFALFWGAGATSDIGTWVQLAAIGSLVASTSGSALSTAMVAAATFAPQGMCSPIGGLLADRYERRRTFLITLGVQTVVTTVMAVAIARGLHNAAALSGLVLLQSSAGALGGPSLQAILPELVPRTELTAAVALGVTGWNAGRVLGPLLAALLVPIGTQWAIGANAVSFAVLWCAIAMMRRHFLPANRGWTSLRSELAAGARALVRSPGCTAALTTIVAMHLLFVPFMGLIPSTARALVVRHHGAITEASVTSVAARLLSAQGIGAIIGSLLVASVLMRLRRSTVITLALTAAVALVPIHALTPTVLTTAITIFVLGSCVAMTQSTLGGVVQRDAPSEQRGRILSWYQGLNGLSYGVGLALMGAAADHFGRRTTFLASGLALAVLVIATQRVGAWSAAIDGEPAPVPLPAAHSAA